ncbi:GNAT family N-acetyltransferase [Roseospira navarrensis]|uniref:GNAT family N-acetyltransferase n=1 Tax=Roseospira navarrensis TaxID=140058 RepID=A0A7X1ZEK8_9PROT|nr:GNAT family N-acetyltransferase [Roseospira navarrensis]MQX36166.1 GNAT family N-acetyltransferase [Roseospira navarrensis]
MRLFPLSPVVAATLARGDLSVVPPGVDVTRVVDLVRAMAGAHRKMYQVTGATAPWLGHLAIAPDPERVVGVCGFKGSCRDGAAEIAYFTFPPFEGRGHAVAMTGCLIHLARAHAEVQELRAHTLPHSTRAARVLEHHGFERLGTVEDSEDGHIWRWRLTLAP